MTDIKFPIFKKYANNMAYFKIDSPLHFSELKKIGSKFSIYCQSIETFADRLQMEHLLSDAPGLEIINELQYEAALASFEANLEKL